MKKKKGEKQLQPSVFRTSSVCKIYQRTVVLTDLDNRLRECFLADVLYRAPLPEQGLLVMSMGQVEVQVYKSRALVCSPGALAAVIHLTRDQSNNYMYTQNLLSFPCDSLTGNMNTSHNPTYASFYFS